MLRLKTRAQFQAVLGGQIVSKTTHFALHRCVLNTGLASEADKTKDPARPVFEISDVWIGAMVPKRWAKRAVTRNTIKRQIYCVSEIFNGSLAPNAHVVRLRKGFDRTVYPSATSDALKEAVRIETEALFNSAVARMGSSHHGT